MFGWLFEESFLQIQGEFQDIVQAHLDFEPQEESRGCLAKKLLDISWGNFLFSLPEIWNRIVSRHHDRI